MICPICKSYQVRVVDSRAYDDQIRRRRECITCGVRFNTIEIPLLEYKVLKSKAHELDLLGGGKDKAAAPDALRGGVLRAR